MLQQGSKFKSVDQTIITYGIMHLIFVWAFRCSQENPIMVTSYERHDASRYRQLDRYSPKFD